MSDDKKKEDFLNILREANEEMTRVQKTRNEITRAFVYLEAISGGRFNYSVRKGNDSLELTTNVRVKAGSTEISLRLAVDGQGNVLSNMPDTEALHWKEQAWLASLNEQLQQLEEQTSRQLTAQGITDEQARAQHIEQEKSRFMSNARYQRGVRDTDVLARTDAETALTDIARMTLLNGYLTPEAVAAVETADAVPPAILNGLHMAQREREMTLEKAQPLFDGLVWLNNLTESRIGFAGAWDKGSSDLKVTVNFKGPQLQSFFLKVSASGEIELSETTLSAQTGLQVADALTVIAKEAALHFLIRRLETDAGNLLLAIVQSEEAAGYKTMPQEAVRAGILLARKDVAMAAAAAGNVEDALSSVQSQFEENFKDLKDIFNFSVKKSLLHGEVILSVNQSTPASVQLRFDAAGTMKVSTDTTVYSAWKEADVTKVVNDITKKAVQHAVRQQKPGL